MASRLPIRAQRLLNRHNLIFHKRSARSLSLWSHPNCRSPLRTPQRPARLHSHFPSASHASVRSYAKPASADSLIEHINDLYATAKDEFEIAAEETEKKTVYAEEDRQGCQEAFQELKEAYESALKDHGPDVGKEVEGRVGHRLRELQNAITAMEESALEE